MAGNDLLVQALMGNQVQQDPALGAVLPRLQMAQAMMQQGMDGSPATKWQGIGRLAQALAGNYIQYKGLDDVQNIVQQRNADTTAQMQYMRGNGGDVPSSTVPPLTQAPPPAQQQAGPRATSQAQPPAEYLPFYQEASARTGIPVNVLIAQHAQESGFDPNAIGKAGEIGIGQVMPATAKSPGFGMTGIDPATLHDPRVNINFSADYLKARGGPRVDFSDPATVDAALKNYNGGGDPNYVANVRARMGGTAPATGVAARTGGVDVAGPGAPSAPADPNAAPPALTGPHTYSRQEALDMMQRSINVMSNPHNQYNPALLKGAQGQLDFAKTLLGLDSYAPGPNGTQRNLNSGKIENAPTPAANYQQTSPGIYTSPGLKPEFAPSPRMATDAHGNLVAAGPGSQITTVSPNQSGFTGSTPEANAMRTLAELGPLVANGTASPQQIANFNVAASAYQQQKPITTSPGQTVTQVPTRPLPAGVPEPVNSSGAPTGAPSVVVSPDNQRIAAQASAAAQGTATGTNAATTLPKMVELGHEADTAIGNIDYGMNQLHQAAAGGINSGYFAPWLATASAAGKSLGVDLGTLGIDPKAVGNVQSAQKTLGVVAGTILQNTLGKDSAITDAKVQHFIHTQPGIETDPQAIERVLGWARSQFSYNRDMAMHAMAHTDPQSGMIPPGWQAQFYKDKGAFAPIYDPLSQEMKQPSGQGPAAEMPKAPPAAGPPVPGARQAPDGNWYVPDPGRPGKYLQAR